MWKREVKLEMSDLQVYLPLANVLINNLGKQATGKPTIRKKKKKTKHIQEFFPLCLREREQKQSLLKAWLEGNTRGIESYYNYPGKLCTKSKQYSNRKRSTSVTGETKLKIQQQETQHREGISRNRVSSGMVAGTVKNLTHLGKHYTPNF